MDDKEKKVTPKKKVVKKTTSKTTTAKRTVKKPSVSKKKDTDTKVVAIKKKKPVVKTDDLNKDKFNTLELILIMVITIVIGILIGNTFKYKANGTNYQNRPNIKCDTELEDVYNTLLNDYYDTVDKDKLKEAAINGMLNYLGDDYSVYMNKEEADDFEERLEGVFYGIGAELVLIDNNTSIYSVFDNSPASEAGLKAGDVIVGVNENDVKGKTPAEISAMIKGNDNLKVKLTVLRDGKEVVLNMTTRAVDIPSIKSSVIEKNGKKIGYINITIFAANTGKQFEKSLKELEKQGIDRLIIDVRDNSGGHLNVVSSIIQLFFKEKDPLYQIKSKNKIDVFYDETKEFRTYPVVVLANAASASGSEILASAFKEVYNSEVIGNKTFGKGTVQTTKDLSTGGLMKYTIQTWLSAKGNAINKVGVSPTIELSLDNKYYEEAKEENDNQLQKAIEVILDK